MIYSDVAATGELLDAVFANLWPRGLEEFRRLGFTPEQALARMKEYIVTGERNFVLLADSKPIAATGAVRSAEDYFTWFQATDDFDHHWKAITRFLKRQAADMDGLRIYSVLVHQDTERWFNLLGFERDGWRGITPAGFPLYRFARK